MLLIGVTEAKKSFEHLLEFESPWGHLLVALQFNLPIERKKYTRHQLAGVFLVWSGICYSEFGKAQ